MELYTNTEMTTASSFQGHIKNIQPSKKPTAKLPLDQA